MHYELWKENNMNTDEAVARIADIIERNSSPLDQQFHTINRSGVIALSYAIGYMFHIPEANQPQPHAAGRISDPPPTAKRKRK